MIIRKMWSTKVHKHLGFHFQGETFNARYTEWEGYFLFGIIPLYIKAINITYTK